MYIMMQRKFVRARVCVFQFYLFFT